MLFNSLDFFIFFPIVTVGYFLIPARWRWIWLLVASCIFYMAFIPVYILVLAATIIVDYIAGIQIDKATGRKRKLWLIFSVGSTCLILFIFKYFNFFNSNLERVAAFFHLNYSVSAINLILPIGLSFHTFQSLSYVMEVYYGRYKSEKHFGIYALYVMFYPQLVAGPIERPQHLLPQFRKIFDFDYRRVADGLKLMVWGMFKKVVIADRLALLVNTVYNKPFGYDGPVLVLATIFFAFQIYCDFSGYSDIAIGSAQVMGFKLVDNFNRPYFSKSIGEFWRRWNISLSTWFRDYVYIPLGGNRVSKALWSRNIMVTFLASGLWHGANWTYIVWGGLNGLYLLCEEFIYEVKKKLFKRAEHKKHTLLSQLPQVIITFLLVCFAWIFFRAATMADALYIVKHMFKGWGNIFSIEGLHIMTSAPHSLGLDKREFVVAIVAIGIMEFVHFMQRHGQIRHMLAKQNFFIRWAVYFILVNSIFIFGATGERQFIYFQF